MKAHMKNLIFSIIIIFMASILFAKITPLPDIKTTDKTDIAPITDITLSDEEKNTDIENINTESQKTEEEIKEADFDSIPLDTTFANESEYEKEVQKQLIEAGYKPTPKDPFYNPDDIYRPPVGNLSLSSRKISFMRGGYHIDGEVEYNCDYYYLKGKNFKNVETDTQYYNNTEDIIFTTCKDHEHPHWSIVAKQIKIQDTPDFFDCHFKNVGFVIGSTKCIWLPFYNQKLSKHPQKNNSVFLFPMIKYSKRRGIGVKYKTELFDTPRFTSDAVIRWDKNINWNYEVNAYWALDRDMTEMPYTPDIKMSNMIDEVNFLGRTSPYKNGMTEEDLSHLRLELSTLWKGEDSTVDGEDTDIYKTISSTLKYTFDPFGNTKNTYKSSLLAPYVSVNYTRMKAEPVIDSYTNKYNATVFMPYSFGNICGVTVQSFLKFAYINYKKYSVYKKYSAGINLSKEYEDSSYWNLRYIHATDRGDAIFDSLKKERGIMFSGVKAINKKYMVGGWLGHNFRTKKTYNVGIMAGIKEDCFWTSLGYDFTDKRVYAKIALLGF